MPRPGRRLGRASTHAFRSEFEPLLRCVWVDAEIHNAGLDLVEDRDRARLSLVDAVSFVVMRRLGIEEAFAFDADFQRERFRLLW
ncbi:MAG: hypothetical protein ACRD01_11255 [Terriglobales bacterium]